jgi:hypothetical protein
MDRPQKMDVVDWQDCPPPVILNNRAPRRFLSPTLIGMLGTLLLHTMVIQSLPFGSRAPKANRSETQEPPDALAKSKADPIERLVLITLPDAAHSREPAIQNVISSLAGSSKMKIKFPVIMDPPALLNFEMLALSEESASKSTANSSDAAELVQLFGIYTGQIQARIDRVWRRPRTPISENAADKKPADADESFQCEAQIIQDARGNVQEILLPRCNGSAVWRNSLVSAIRQASPLPAPPSAKVFTYSISLQFVGLRYVSGSPEDGYEIETSRFARE